MRLLNGGISPIILLLLVNDTKAYWIGISKNLWSRLNLWFQHLTKETAHRAEAQVLHGASGLIPDTDGLPNIPEASKYYWGTLYTLTNPQIYQIWINLHIFTTVSYNYSKVFFMDYEENCTPTRTEV